jgi:hypothetical protein
VILFVVAFIELGQSKIRQLVLCLFCAMIAAGLLVFASAYLALKRRNVTTIEEMFPPQGGGDLPNAPVFEGSLWAFVPFPRSLNPFELFPMV